MGIDFEVDRFFNRIASLHMDLMDNERWCRKYKSFNYPKWTMKNGKKIALCEMTDEHLYNTIALVERKDPSNGWLKILKQEKRYRELKNKIKNDKSELYRMEEVRDKVF